MQTVSTKNNFFYLQATAVLYQGKSFLIMGPPGCGKSRLTYGLIQKGGQLINDDLVYLKWQGKKLILTPLTRYAGYLYLRGSGFLAVPHYSHKCRVQGLVLLGHTPVPKIIPKACLRRLFIIRR